MAPAVHVVVVGYQPHGTLGRRLVDGVEYVRLWQHTITVNATVHTIGGLSAHADQQGPLDWYSAFSDRPPVCLVHGEPEAQGRLATELENRYQADVSLPQLGEARQL